MNQELDDLSCFFNPSSIAIIGASRNKEKAGYGILKNVISTFQDKSKIYPINPFAEEILGLRVYPSLNEIDNKIDLVIMFVSPNHIPELIEQCSEKGVRGVIIESAGFAEVGSEGLKIQNEIKTLGEKYNIRIWGGNCMGTITDELITTFEIIAEDIKRKGGLSIVGQSGYFSGAVILQLFTERFLGVRKACSIGNKIDVDETDLLRHFLQDKQTKVAAFYLEDLKKPRLFVQLAKKFTRNRPLICLLGGQSNVGKKAALSHTSSTAGGTPEIIPGVLKQAKIIPVKDFSELFDTMEIFSKLPLPIGNRLAIVTITGAGGVVGADITSRTILEIPKLNDSTKESLQAVFPDWMPPQNPVDSWPAFELHGIDGALRRIIPILFDSNEIDMIFLMIAAMNVAKTFNPEIISEMSKFSKPIITYFVGDSKVKLEWTEKIRKDGGVVCESIESGVKLFEILYAFSERIKKNKKILR